MIRINHLGMLIFSSIQNAFIKGFGDKERTALSMNNYFSIKISNESFRNLTKFFKGTSLMPYM